MLTYYEIQEKANAQHLNNLLWTIRHLLIYEEFGFKVNERKARLMDYKIRDKLTALINKAIEEQDTSSLTLEDFKHLKPSYIFAKAFASLLEV